MYICVCVSILPRCTAPLLPPRSSAAESAAQKRRHADGPQPTTCALASLLFSFALTQSRRSSLRLCLGQTATVTSAHCGAATKTKEEETVKKSAETENALFSRHFFLSSLLSLSSSLFSPFPLSAHSAHVYGLHLLKLVILTTSSPSQRSLKPPCSSSTALDARVPAVASLLSSSGAFATGTAFSHSTRSRCPHAPRPGDNRGRAGQRRESRGVATCCACKTAARHFHPRRTHARPRRACESACSTPARRQRDEDETAFTER